MLIVVGGHSRDIGKTSVVAGLIRALPEAGWTAMKITQFGHGVCSAAGKPCGCCLAPEHPYSIAREERPNRSDTGRFLSAGACASYWMRTAAGQLEQALPVVRQVAAASRNLIIESNSIVEFIKPDLYFAVLDFAKQDFKASCARLLGRADACVLVGRPGCAPRWPNVTHEVWATKPRFNVSPPDYVTPALVDFVRRAGL
ncbi:MAG TPA: hypothetical protein VMT86_02500 [Bryobacteraceae bacterium]|nr:hypothetical protein [Bryobacteraceae bacterium]